MTWGEFKAWVEARGVDDFSLIMRIDIYDCIVEEIEVFWDEETGEVHIDQ